MNLYTPEVDFLEYNISAIAKNYSIRVNTAIGVFLADNLSRLGQTYYGKIKLNVIIN